MAKSSGGTRGASIKTSAPRLRLDSEGLTRPQSERLRGYRLRMDHLDSQIRKIRRGGSWFPGFDGTPQSIRRRVSSLEFERRNLQRVHDLEKERFIRNNRRHE